MLVTRAEEPSENGLKPWVASMASPTHLWSRGSDAAFWTGP